MKLTKMAKVYLVVIILCFFGLAQTLFIQPKLAEFTDREFTPPRALNSLMLVGVIGSMVGYVIEMHYIKEQEKNE